MMTEAANENVKEALPLPPGATWAATSSGSWSTTRRESSR